MGDWIDGHTVPFGLLGSPVGHSGSPAMYNYCFEKDGLNCVYLAFDIDLNTLDAGMSAVKALHFKGINVTMPCKSAALKYADECTKAVQLIGATNCMVCEDGKWIAHNTDGIGYVNNLKAHGVDVAEKKITLIGGGGVGMAILVQCALSGAKEISVFNIRDSFMGNLEKHAELVNREVPGCTVRVLDLADKDKLSAEIASSQILTNATRVGMAPQEQSTPIPDAGVFHKSLTVADTVYNPRETRLIREAKAAGCLGIGGIGMLVRQGEAAYRIFTGKAMPVEEIQKKFFDN
ncbi:shikimate dehydrogenase [Caproiciproducens sp. NJN-50]|uniref:shikimate dehydrogenase n=1 Tax=Caproiciproducens sp. NJN-50 TaxID=2507162 RepID=UPI000FFE267D|nr:shikimate dehydrogenase [Caproiciproducens sp. NJN-50]QAT48951.1 shikimate dehydrogenase [Caproiciproducens sp. NJN-50]